MTPQDTVSEESQENGEDDLQSPLWREVGRANIGVIKGVIEEIVENKDTLPEQLFEVADIISATSSDIDLLNNHKEDFEQLLCDASCLVVVLWQSYNKSKYPSIWPPPKLGKVIDKLTDTMYSIYNLMTRKCEKNFAKRILVGYFGIRDLRKFKKYQEKLGSVASYLELVTLDMGGEPHIDINRLLLEVINSRSQPQDTDNELPEEPAENSLLRKVEKSSAAKPTNQRVKSEEDIQRKSKALGKQKAKDSAVGNSDDECVEARSAHAKKKTSGRRMEEEVMAQPDLKGAKRTKKVRHTKVDEEAETEGKGKRARNKESDEEDEEDEGSRTNKADIPVPKVSSKKKQPATTPKQKVRPQPTVAPAQSSVSGFTFSNSGAGIMVNEDIGNIYTSTISGVGNDHSVNRFYARKKRA